MKLTLPFKTAVNFSPPVAILGYKKLRQENVLHQTTCDSKKRISFFTTAFEPGRRMAGYSVGDHIVNPDFIAGDEIRKLDSLFVKRLKESWVKKKDLA